MISLHHNLCAYRIPLCHLLLFLSDELHTETVHVSKIGTEAFAIRVEDFVDASGLGLLSDGCVQSLGVFEWESRLRGLVDLLRMRCEMIARGSV